MGDYDKIGRPSRQDGVGRLTRFSPRDDPVQLPSSTSMAIQLPQLDRRAAGVTSFFFFVSPLTKNLRTKNPRTKCNLENLVGG